MTHKFTENAKAAEVCSQVLGVPLGDEWNVGDIIDSLAIVRAKDLDFDGTVIDVETKEVVVPASLYTHNVVSSNLSPINGGGIGVFMNQRQEGLVATFSPKGMHATPVFDGVVLRVYWYNSQMRFATISRIESDRSRWGGSAFFVDTFKAIGPSAEDLFDTTVPFSSTVYYFMLVDPHVMIATKQQVDQPYLVFIESREVERASVVTAPGKKNDCGEPLFARRMLHYLEFKDMKQHQERVFECQPMTLEEIEDFLVKGYYDLKISKHETIAAEQRLAEAVVIVTAEGKGLKIMSESYEWRRNLRDENINVVQQFYILLDQSVPIAQRNENARIKYYPMCDIIVDYDNVSAWKSSLKEELLRNGVLPPLPCFGTGIAKTSSVLEHAQILIWINYVSSLPAHLQFEALDFYEDLIADRMMLADWIVGYATRGIVVPQKYLSIVPDRLKKIAFGVNKYYRNDRMLGAVLLVQREYGMLVYPMVKIVKEFVHAMESGDYSRLDKLVVVTNRPVTDKIREKKKKFSRQPRD